MNTIAMLVLALVLGVISMAYGATMTVTVNKIDESGVGAAIGTLKLEDTNVGLLITPDLSGLPSGDHGFHIHANADCGPGEQSGTKVAGLAAGGDFYPIKNWKNLRPGRSQRPKRGLPPPPFQDQGHGTPEADKPPLNATPVH